MVKYWINENKSCEISNLRFFGVWFHSDNPLLTLDASGGRGLQNLLTSACQNIKSTKISHVRYPIIDFLCSDSILILLIDLRWSWRSWPPKLFYLWRSKIKSLKISHVRCSDSILIPNRHRGYTQRPQRIDILSL